MDGRGLCCTIGLSHPPPPSPTDSKGRAILLCFLSQHLPLCTSACFIAFQLSIAISPEILYLISRSLSLIAFKGRLPQKAEFMSIENLKTFGKLFCHPPNLGMMRATTADLDTIDFYDGFSSASVWE